MCYLRGGMLRRGILIAMVVGGQALVYSTAIRAEDAGGVSIGRTRVIYSHGDAQTTMPVRNSSSIPYLIQSWVTSADGGKTTDFVVIPPLAVIKPGDENTLRIIYTGDGNQPKDRESVYYINNKFIPSQKRNASTEGSTLQLVVQSVVKLFSRPKNLTIASNKAPEMLHCNLSAGNLTLTNLSPYYVTAIEININGELVPNTMIAPKSNVSVPVPGQARGNITLQTLDDYGTASPVRVCTS